MGEPVRLTRMGCLHAARLLSAALLWLEAGRASADPPATDTVGQNAAAAQADEVIVRVYREILRRDPDESGLATYRKHLLTAGRDEAWLREVLRNSSEAAALDARRGHRQRAWGVVLLTAAASLTTAALARRYAGRSAYPAGKAAAAIAALAVCAALNLALLQAGLDTGVPRRFPISEAFWSDRSGAPWLVPFVAVVAVGTLSGRRLGPLGCWVFFLLAVALGNLLQGSFEAGFLDPFVRNGDQLYQQALRITSPRLFLNEFNTAQQDLCVHGRTHPPFAVLLHWLFAGLGRNHAAVLSAAFLAAASLTAPALWHTLRLIGAGPPTASRAVVLLALLPAVNIYSAASLSGVIAGASALFLLGLIGLLEDAPRARHLALFGGGLLAVNAVSFGGTFHLAVAGLVAVWEMAARRRARVAAALCASLLAGAGIVLLLRAATGYNHIEAFFTASRLENPNGFLGFHAPLRYAMTRIEGIAEIVFFASLGAAPLLLPAPAGPGPGKWRFSDAATAVSAAAAAVLLLMLAAGAYRTGETARACMFLYPFLMLRTARLAPATLGLAAWLAGLQTAVMQWVGDYFW